MIPYLLLLLARTLAARHLRASARLTLYPRPEDAPEAATATPVATPAPAVALPAPFACGGCGSLTARQFMCARCGGHYCTACLAVIDFHQGAYSCKGCTARAFGMRGDAYGPRTSV